MIKDPKPSCSNIKKMMKALLLGGARLTCIALFCRHFPCNAEPMPPPASIQSPGADLANFPNSAFTLPQGRAYIELSPNYSSRSANDIPAQFSGAYLLRYGLIDTVELRLLSNGYTMLHDDNETKGMSPQTFDLKWHVMDEHEDSFLPAVGVEVSLQTDWASPAFKSGIQPALSLNFDQTLPFDTAFEYNLGFVTQPTASGSTQYQLALSWALQREVIDDVAVFVNGYTNTANGLSTSAMGGGMQWTPVQRVAVFTNVAAGLTVSTPSIFALLGFAVAF